MPDLILIFGPPAVGKMTVGKKLAMINGLKLMHTQMCYTLAGSFYKYETQDFHYLNYKIKLTILKHLAKSDIKGIIITFVWDFGNDHTKLFCDYLINLFKPKPGKIYFIELYADIASRRMRNTSPLRLKNKPFKRNLVKSFQKFNDMEQSCSFDSSSMSDYFAKHNYIKINNTNVSPTEACDIIHKKFQLT